MNAMKNKKLSYLIKWAHAVNSQKYLDHVLNDTKIDMIEADVMLGALYETRSVTKIPIMAHPPNTISDISLKMFLDQIMKHNNVAKENNKKGVKLDFKSIEVFEASLNVLHLMLPKMKCPIWLNADILKGPVDENETIPVDPQRFFMGCRKFKDAVISIGWTTFWREEITNPFYTTDQVQQMLDVIKKFDIYNYGQKLTFPVRAVFAANSQTQLLELLISSSVTHKVTLTIWSSPDDRVDVEKLWELICTIGVSRVYIDLPSDLAIKLDKRLHERNGSLSYPFRLPGNTFLVIIAMFSILYYSYFYY
ncbi:protein FAM151B isoform X2 [Teleopsis dalmanni]|nr:protein FAM151B isoform X2 [Teleopsis dalmanni]